MRGLWKLFRWLLYPHPCPASPEEDYCPWVNDGTKGLGRTRYCPQCRRTQALSRCDTYEPDYCWETIDPKE